jgi:hypothetical protein
MLFKLLAYIFPNDIAICVNYLPEVIGGYV